MTEMLKTGKRFDVKLERTCHVVSRVAWRIAMDATAGIVLQSSRCLDRFETPDSTENLLIHAEVNASDTGGLVRFRAGVIRNGKKVDIAIGSSSNAQMRPTSSSLDPLPALSSFDSPPPPASTPVITLNLCTTDVLAKADITINVNSIN
ncbi:unnamed protein product [Caenorhabditis nigoni]